MAGNNNIAQLMKLNEKMQAKLEENNKKVEAMAAVLQNLSKES